MHLSALVTQSIMWQVNLRLYHEGFVFIAELILGLRPANERRRYFVTTSLIGWVET